MNSPDFAEAGWLESDTHGLLLKIAMVAGLELCRRHIARRRHQLVMVEPGHPFGRCEFDRSFARPMSPAMDQFGLVQPDDRLGQGTSPNPVGLYSSL